MLRILISGVSEVMGSFNATCIVSNLPIEAGTLVRFLALTKNAYHELNEHICYVTGRWQLRCPPILAVYDDYGSIEQIEPRLATRVFFKSFERDAVEKGVGDNQCHDVHVRKGMSEDDWLKALWEGRVQVRDHHPSPPGTVYKRPEPKPGWPCFTSIENAFKAADLPLVTAYGAKGYVLDEVSHGFFRIRWGRFDAESESECLAKTLPVLEAAGFAAMMTCGTGNYANGAEILVAPKPGKTEEGHQRRANGVQEDDLHKSMVTPRPVSQAMVREDVWQILLTTPVESWRGDFTFEMFMTDAKAVLAEELSHKKAAEEFEAKTKAGQITKEELREFFHKETMRRLEPDFQNRFVGSIHGGEGVFGFGLQQAFEMGIEMHETPEELEGFIQDLAETAYVQWQYASLHGQWQPTTNSGQDGNWKGHRAFLQKLIEIKGHYEDENEGDDE